jgi:single-stranded-DNA-specific exonuclease
MENATEALELLVANDAGTAGKIAESLDSRNRERQAVERTISETAASQIRNRFDPARDYVLVESKMYWHIGVLGIVASRVLREFYRPTIIIGGEGEEWRGSGRSIAGFDLAAVLCECDDLLVSHGGHAMAAGISIHPSNIDAFQTRLNELARKQIHPNDLQPPLELDCEANGTELTLNTVRELERLAPTGQSNPTVRLFIKGVSLARAPRRIGRDGSHVKLQVTDGIHTWDAVWWEGGDEKWPVGTFDLAFTPEINEYRNEVNVQLRVHDWRPATAS